MHPRSAELLIVLKGILEVGFVDTENQLFLQTLQAHDLFIFPKGLVHFQVNTKPDCKAVALGVFGSASAGTVSIPVSVFGSGIDVDILAKAFHTDDQIISELVQTNKNFKAKAKLTRQTTALIAKAIQKEFPALEGQSVPVAKIIYPPSGIKPQHAHLQSAKLLIFLEGILEVGFVDTENQLFLETLHAHNLFIFPKGLVHFQVNTKPDRKAVALGVFRSTSAGTVSILASVFGSGIDVDILGKAFHTDDQIISELAEANK
ncbi:hypothetical protein NL676_010397 [Syzygium grande]|nr:hypothetical protein NL676_010397 [Syzygium grande]